MNHDEVAQRIANSHELIQTKPVDRLDCILKTKAIKLIILNCMAHVDQLYYSPETMDYSEEDLSLIHEKICVSAIPLLHMVEHFLEKAEVETREAHFAV